jgi:hypothetical protein
MLRAERAIWLCKGEADFEFHCKIERPLMKLEVRSSSSKVFADDIHDDDTIRNKK